jgi:ribosomal protein S18 acetylase RimI-like enzyme
MSRVSAAWSLRPATTADLPFLLELRLATMTPHFERQGRSPTVVEHRQRVEHWLDVAQVIECDGQRAGVLKLVREDREWTLEQVQLVPSLQGQGLGAALLAEVVAQAQAAGASLTLHVLKGNPARRLYVRLGFEDCAESEDGWTMQLRGSSR